MRKKTRKKANQARLIHEKRRDTKETATLIHEKITDKNKQQGWFVKKKDNRRKQTEKLICQKRQGHTNSMRLVCENRTETKANSKVDRWEKKRTRKQHEVGLWEKDMWETKTNTNVDLREKDRDKTKQQRWFERKGQKEKDGEKSKQHKGRSKEMKKARTESTSVHDQNKIVTAVPVLSTEIPKAHSNGRHFHLRMKGSAGDSFDMQNQIKIQERLKHKRCLFGRDKHSPTSSLPSERQWGVGWETDTGWETGWETDTVRHPLCPQRGLGEKQIGLPPFSTVALSIFHCFWTNCANFH